MRRLRKDEKVDLAQATRPELLEDGAAYEEVARREAKGLREGGGRPRRRARRWVNLVEEG